MVNPFFHAVALLLLLSLHDPVAAQEVPQVYLGASSKTLGYSPLWVGAKRGFFEQQGLDVHLILLRGGTIGASSLTSATVTALKEALRQKGLEYPRDYKLLIVAGGSASNLTALQSGQITATTVAVPLNYAAEEAGFNTLGRLLDAVPNFQAASLAIRRSWAGKNRPLMVRFMKAMVRSHRWLHDNRDAAVEFIAKEMQLKPAHALKGWEYYTQNRIWPADGEPNIEGMRHNLRVYAEQNGAKGPPPDVRKFVELSYLSEALTELGKR